MLGHEMSASVPKLYVLPGSHPCAAVEEAMRRKAIDFRRVDLLPLVPHLVGPLRYGGSTVPGMRIGDRKVLGSRSIMRALDEISPEPPLLPPAGPERDRVLEAERWGDDVFQSVPRRILDVGFLREPLAMESYAGDARLPLPAAMLRPGLPLTARLMARKNHATDASARADIQPSIFSSWPRSAWTSALALASVAWFLRAISFAVIGRPGRSIAAGKGSRASPA